MNSNQESNDVHNKRQRDKFYIILFGLIGYSLILIGIVIGTFFIVKGIFKSRDKEIESTFAAEQVVEEPVESTVADEEEILPELQVVDEVKEEPKERLNEHLIDVEEFLSDEIRIDYSKTLFEPSKRNKDLEWKDTVFSRLENVTDPTNAIINSYHLSRKNAVKDNDRELEFCIYNNVDSTVIEKITTVEKCPGNFEIIDYYYDNGNINYIDERSATIDVPVDITSGAVKSRYYFAKDMLVKYSYCENDKATVFSAAALDSYSEGTISQYEALEAKMINQAYITYNAARVLPESQRIEGYILDEYDQPLDGAEIKVFSDADKSEVARTTTDGDGHYAFSIAVNDNNTYTLLAKKNSLDDVRIYGITAKAGSGVYYVATPRLTYSDDGAEYNATVVVRDSIDNNLSVAGASIKLRSGLYAKDGDVKYSGTLDATGAIIFTLQAGNYTAEVSKGGYETSYFNVIVNHNRQATVGYLVKDLRENQLQMILSWDTTPLDLDGKLIVSNATDLLRGNQDSVGSLMTETINADIGNGYMYTYYVSDYSNCVGGDINSPNMSASGAKVDVYGCDGLIASLDVPKAHLGVVWEPFIIRNGVVIPINHYYNAIDQSGYFTAK